MSMSSLLLLKLSFKYKGSRKTQTDLQYLQLNCQIKFQHFQETNNDLERLNHYLQFCVLECFVPPFLDG